MDTGTFFPPGLGHSVWRFSSCYYVERLLKIHWAFPGTFLVRRQKCIATSLHKSSMNTSESFYYGTVIKILPHVDSSSMKERQLTTSGVFG
jgi:hypothetical protein